MSIKLSELPKRIIQLFQITAFFLKHKLTKSHSQIHIYSKRKFTYSNSKKTNIFTIITHQRLLIILSLLNGLISLLQMTLHIKLHNYYLK